MVSLLTIQVMAEVVDLGSATHSNRSLPCHRSVAVVNQFQLLPVAVATLLLTIHNKLEMSAGFRALGTTYSAGWLMISLLLPKLAGLWLHV